MAITTPDLWFLIFSGSLCWVSELFGVCATGLGYVLKLEEWLQHVFSESCFPCCYRVGVDLDQHLVMPFNV